MFSSSFFKRFKSLVSRPEDTYWEDLKSAPPMQPTKIIFPMQHYSPEQMKDLIYDLVRTIMDPEKPYTLEDLNVVYENGIEVRKTENSIFYVNIEFKPTVPHCNLATLIGLCINVKIKRLVLAQCKLRIIVKKGSHLAEDEVNKQINDKERVAAAMENPTLETLVEKCIKEPE